ncbi:hypothetical protein [Pseudoclavibacter endophyticus]|uniref:Uncharacterized protein n=1 Tax=Pseudoclavibacter endophyticus TaxID=1778590 RepID=A0A6H9WHG6_9MICO|nr:hypothetical protein [Pseudoclavibacter endophyticus]KAB1650399.1 hypothetical protein F8O04_09575 [Pseudoclavibacter endophyticus]
MLTVYLDQNKWIDLARAATGHPQGARFVETLAVLRAAADDGRARFPLSLAHYYETGKQGDLRKREDLAATMMRLAGMLRIAPPHVIAPWEIRRALIDTFGLPIPVEELDLFGSGIAHAAASPALSYVAPAEYLGVPLPAHVQQELQRRAEPEFERVILAGATPDGMPDELRIVLHDMKNLTDDRFVDGQRSVAEALKKLGRGRLNDVMVATAVADIIDPLLRISRELGIAFNDVLDRMTHLVEAIPSRWVEMKLRHVRQANPQKAWSGNDLNDVTALAIAVPYCDIVVTEKSWASMLTDAKVPARFRHVVTASLDDLVRYLEAAPQPRAEDGQG